MPNKINLKGKKFGRLKVLKESKKRSNGNVMWSCQCDCGKKVIVRGKALRKGNTKACGCLRLEQFISRNTNSPSERKQWRSYYEKLAQDQGYKLISPTYINAKTKLELFCKKHELIFYQLPYLLQIGLWCPKCGLEKRGISRKKYTQTNI